MSAKDVKMTSRPLDAMNKRSPIQITRDGSATFFQIILHLSIPDEILSLGKDFMLSSSSSSFLH